MHPPPRRTDTHHLRSPAPNAQRTSCRCIKPTHTGGTCTHRRHGICGLQLAQSSMTAQHRHKRSVLEKATGPGHAYYSAHTAVPPLCMTGMTPNSETASGSAWRPLGRGRSRWWVVTQSCSLLDLLLASECAAQAKKFCVCGSCSKLRLGVCEIS